MPKDTDILVQAIVNLGGHRYRTLRGGDRVPSGTVIAMPPDMATEAIAAGHAVRYTKPDDTPIVVAKKETPPEEKVDAQVPSTEPVEEAADETSEEEDGEALDLEAMSFTELVELSRKHNLPYSRRDKVALIAGLKEVL